MSPERQVNVGLGTVVALGAAIAAVWRSPRLLLVAFVGVAAEVAYRRWLSQSSSDVAERLRSRAGHGS